MKRRLSIVVVAAVVGSTICARAQAARSSGSRAALAAPANQASPILEVRLAEEAPGAGLSETTVAGSSAKIHLHPETVVTNADVVSAHVIRGDRAGTFNVGIMFSSDGSAKMEKATQAHLNKPLAILVNGRVVSAPVLRSEIRRSAVITGDLTKAEADALAASLSAR